MYRQRFCILVSDQQTCSYALSGVYKYIEFHPSELQITVLLLLLKFTVSYFFHCNQANIQVKFACSTILDQLY